jgi:hypothetical protein
MPHRADVTVMQQIDAILSAIFTVLAKKLLPNGQIIVS